MNATHNALVIATDVSADYLQETGWDAVLRHVSLTINRGEIVGLAGESGSGKSTLGSIIMGERMANRRVAKGQVDFDGYDMQQIPPRELQRLHGSRIGFVPQNGGNSLTPTLRIAGHFAETLNRHRPGMSRAEVAGRTRALLEKVGIPDPVAAMRRYPHQFSGGQQQRITLALALCAEPDLLILDEPTTGQDAVIRQSIVALLRDIAADGQTAMLFVSHDLATISELCSRVVVMKLGEIVEDGSVARVLGAPEHPYTQTLVAALPRIDAPPAAVTEHRAPTPATGQRSDILHLDGITYRYDSNNARPVLDQVSLAVAKGETLALVGESGSGKSTLLRIAAGLIPQAAGALAYDGQQIAQDAARRSLEERRQVQIIFQNPDRSLNGQKRIGDILARPLEMFFGMKGAERDREVARLLDDVQLPASYARRYPSELSGGQKQRVAIARALAARPSILLCDEVISALDVSIQVQILDLLRQIRTETNMAMLFVTHDLAVVRWFADRIVVLYRGQIIEELRPEDLDRPEGLQPYTRQLLQAAPRVNVA